MKTMRLGYTRQGLMERAAQREGQAEWAGPWYQPLDGRAEVFGWGLYAELADTGHDLPAGMEIDRRSHNNGERLIWWQGQYWLLIAPAEWDILGGGYYRGEEFGFARPQCVPLGSEPTDPAAAQAAPHVERFTAALSVWAGQVMVTPSLEQGLVEVSFHGAARNPYNGPKGERVEVRSVDLLRMMPDWADAAEAERGASMPAGRNVTSRFVAHVLSLPSEYQPHGLHRVLAYVE